MDVSGITKNTLRVPTFYDQKHLKVEVMGNSIVKRTGKTNY